MAEPIYFRVARRRSVSGWLRTPPRAAELIVGFHKVGSGAPSMTWPQSVDAALCFGWIDGVRKRIDDARYQIRFTPRRATSIWSRVNIDRVAVLTAEGRMTPAGLAAYARRSEERSAVYTHEQSGEPELPPALKKRFKADKAAWQWFETQPPGWRRTTLRWVLSAKQDETRERRLAQVMTAAAVGKRL